MTDSANAIVIYVFAIPTFTLTIAHTQSPTGQTRSGGGVTVVYPFPLFTVNVADRSGVGGKSDSVFRSSPPDLLMTHCMSITAHIKHTLGILNSLILHPSSSTLTRLCPFT
jgi:hypothetical protein